MIDTSITSISKNHDNLLSLMHQQCHALSGDKHQPINKTYSYIIGKQALKPIRETYSPAQAAKQAPSLYNKLSHVQQIDHRRCFIWGVPGKKERAPVVQRFPSAENIPKIECSVSVGVKVGVA